MKRVSVLPLFFLILALPALAEITSLSHLFALGKTLQDLDGDGHADKILLSIILPDNPTAAETALASDIAARANLESLVQDFALVRRESEIENWESLPNPILIGCGTRWGKEIAREAKIDPSRMGQDKGKVFVFTYRNQRGIACFAGSDDALLRTGRAFFLRWPYFWEIWGRENGSGYLSFENDLAKFLEQENVSFHKTVIQEADFEFPPSSMARGALEGLQFSEGEITQLSVDLHFADEDDFKRIFKSLDLLRKQRVKGQRTSVLSYPACARIAFELHFGKQSLPVSLPRLGSSGRLLTPAFKETVRIPKKELRYDLATIFTADGLFSDRDQDGILDGVETSVVIPASGSVKGVPGLASKLMLPTAGASFPLVYLDSEIERPKTLIAPILVGDNALVRDLKKSGKLVLPPLESAWGSVQIVSEAFNKTGALVVSSADAPGLDKTLSYFSETFPYFDDFKEGRPSVGDVPEDFARFLAGEKGGAEIYFEMRLRSLAEEIKDRTFETFEVRIRLPRENKPFEEGILKFLGSSVKADSLKVENSLLSQGLRIFEKEAEFPWEADEALSHLRNGLAGIEKTTPLRISIGLSESPEVRANLKKKAEEILAENGFTSAEVETASAYKQGFFWLTEKILPQLKARGIHHLVIRFAQTPDSRNKLKRAYGDPNRWLQELYPADEIMARELMLPVERIEFETKPEGLPFYEVTAFDEKNAVILNQSFTPRTREIPFFEVLPEWGTSTVATGWIRIDSGNKNILDASIETDLEKFWSYYQKEVIAPLHAHVLKKTDYKPTSGKMPFFKRLLVDLQASEPDYRLGLDEERISSLEAIHDEIYFDTLDFLKAIIRPDDDKAGDEEAPSSPSPGGVLPIIHRSTESGNARIRILFEDIAANRPEMEILWKEKGRDAFSSKIVFPEIKTGTVRMPSFVYNGQEDLMEALALDIEVGNESDYLLLLEILDGYAKLAEKGWNADPLSYPRLKALTVGLRWGNLSKQEKIPVAPPAADAKTAAGIPDGPLVPSGEILSPDAVTGIVERLSSFKHIRAYTAGRSHEGRIIPVLEIGTPFEKYTSTARLITFKPTLQISCRQHANEVSSTNYALRLAELLARDRYHQDLLRKMTVVITPMENPDGAALAFELNKLTPFHSLHAGRTGILGADIGSRSREGRKPLPEDGARERLFSKWHPDIFLNLHGYPSHEWVQAFSQYAPYLFRDYWIPRGFFAYAKTLTLPLYGKWKEAGDELLAFLAQEIRADEKAGEINKRLADRYSRWAARFSPHIGALEFHDGVNIYVKRQSSRENRLTFRSRMTFMEQTPELMDETASGPWLSFLEEQGMTYLKAHLNYLNQVRFEFSRIEEEAGNRILIEFRRSRPGSLPKMK